ncbi:MAG TPA: universal stress protein [Acidimicrobiales bacterium]|jgi:nucleotide-binding universal stress UspA family protein
MYRKILVGTDGSATAQKAVARAVQVAQLTGGTLTVLMAGKGPRAENAVHAAASAHAGSGVAIDTAVIDDDPESALVGEATRGGYDLVVTGNKGMTGVRHFLQSSVPNKVGHAMPANFLIVATT